MPKSRRPIVQALHSAAGRADGDLLCSNPEPLMTALLHEALGRPPGTPRVRCAIRACRPVRPARQPDPLAATVFHVEHTRHRLASEAQDDSTVDGVRMAARMGIARGIGRRSRLTQLPLAAGGSEGTVWDGACRGSAWEATRDDPDPRRHDTSSGGVPARRRPGTCPGTWGSAGRRATPWRRALRSGLRKPRPSGGTVCGRMFHVERPIAAELADRRERRGGRINSGLGGPTAEAFGPSRARLHPRRRCKTHEGGRAATGRARHRIDRAAWLPPEAP